MTEKNDKQTIKKYIKQYEQQKTELWQKRKYKRHKEQNEQQITFKKKIK